MLTAILTAVGVYAMLAYRDYLKMVIGLFLIQSSIILFFILLAVRRDGLIPIGSDADASAGYHNPLPHALMLTAIVVGVATLGLALSILRRILIENHGLREDDPPRGHSPAIRHRNHVPPIPHDGEAHP